MIKVLIVDDEQHCVDRVIELISPYNSDFKIVSTSNSIDEAFLISNRLKPDLIFLDVHINNKTGFDFLKLFKTYDFDVIFTTAFEKYALEAFKFSAVDYLLKPISKQDFNNTIEKYKNNTSSKYYKNKIDVLIHNFENKNNKKISIPTLDGFEFLEVSNIIRCQADINYTHIFLVNNKKITVSKTLKSFEEILSNFNFFRVHNSHLINLSFIEKYSKGKGGYVTMKGNTNIEVSTRRKDEFLKELLNGNV